MGLWHRESERACPCGQKLSIDECRYWSGKEGFLRKRLRRRIGWIREKWIHAEGEGDCKARAWILALSRLVVDGLKGCKRKASQKVAKESQSLQMNTSTAVLLSSQVRFTDKHATSETDVTFQKSNVSLLLSLSLSLTSTFSLPVSRDDKKLRGKSLTLHFLLLKQIQLYARKLCTVWNLLVIFTSDT